MSEFHVEKREISMLCAESIPAQIDVRDIAEEAAQVAFGYIHERLERAGFKASGDIMPDEAHALDAMFDLFVRSAAVNNGRVQAMNNAGGIRRGFRVAGLEACAPEELPVVEGVEVVRTGTMDTSSRCPVVEVTATTREALLSYVRTNWGVDDVDGDMDEWFAEVVASVEAFGHDRVSVAATAYERVYEGDWGLKASEEDALLGVLCALYPFDFPEDAEGIYKIRATPSLVDLADWLGENAADLYGDDGARDIIDALLPNLDSAMKTSLLATARHLGVEVEVARFEPYALAETLWEISLLDEGERAAAVRAVNDGAQVKDRAAYAEVAEPRTILIHLNVQVDRDDTRTADTIITQVEGALDVGLEGMENRDETRVDVALAEEV